jgi:hypothetical protein
VSFLPKPLSVLCAAVLGLGAPLAAEGTTATDLTLDAAGEVRLVFGTNAHLQPFWGFLKVVRKDTGAALAFTKVDQDLVAHLPAAATLTFSLEFPPMALAMVEVTYAVPFTLVDDAKQVRAQVAYAAHQARTLDGKGVLLVGHLEAAIQDEETKAGGVKGFLRGPFGNEPLVYLGQRARPAFYRVAINGTPIKATEQKVPASQSEGEPAEETNEVATLDLSNLVEAKKS